MRRQVIAMGCWLGLVAGLSGCGSVLIAEGDAAMEARDYATAVSRYRQARAKGEGDPDEVGRKLATAAAGAARAHRTQAEAHEKAGRWEEAMAAWDDARSFAGNDTELRASAAGARGRAAAAVAAQAEAARAQGNLAGAIEALTAAMEWDPEEPGYRTTLVAVYLDHARARVAERDIEAALAAYGKAAALDPTNTDAANGLKVQQDTERRVGELVAKGREHEKQDEFDAAVGAYDEALVLWPGHPEASKRKKALENTKAFLDAFRKGVANLNAKLYVAAIAAFNEAAKYRETDVLEQKRNEAYRLKWMADADAAVAAGDALKAVENLEQAQRYTEQGTPDWEALTARIRKTHYDRLMAIGRDHEVNKRWREAEKVYRMMQEKYAEPTDDDLNERIIEVDSHLSRVDCNWCNKTGKLTKYRLDGDEQIPVGKIPCKYCEGTGIQVTVKEGG